MALTRNGYNGFLKVLQTRFSSSLRIQCHWAFACLGNIVKKFEMMKWRKRVFFSSKQSPALDNQQYSSCIGEHFRCMAAGVFHGALQFLVIGLSRGLTAFHYCQHFCSPMLAQGYGTLRLYDTANLDKEGKSVISLSGSSLVLAVFKTRGPSLIFRVVKPLFCF